MILSFQSYFIFTPFQNGFGLLSLLQFMTIVGWILLTFGPPMFFYDSSSWSQNKFILFCVTVSFWTVSVTGIKLYTLFTAGQIFAEYLIRIPLFLFIEWVLPPIYILIARNYVNQRNSRKDNQIEFDEEEKSPNSTLL